MWTVNASLLALVAGTVLPIIVGLVTKQLASGSLKAIILALMAAATGLVNGAINLDGMFTQEALIAALVTWVTASATYFGFLSPTNITGAVQTKTANFGLGKIQEGDSEV